MALSKKEREELAKLMVGNFDKEGKALPDADLKALKRVEELLVKSEPEPETGATAPMKLKNFVHCDLSKQLIADGAEFVGVEVRNHGTEDKPKMVWREWMYVGVKGSKDPAKERKCLFVQYLVGHQGDAIAVDAGRTIAEAGLRRFQR